MKGRREKIPAAFREGSFARSITVAAALLLILGIAIERTGSRTRRSADGSPFKSTSRLMADDAAGRRAEETACYGTALGVGTGGFRAVAEGEGAKGGYDDEVCFFHGVI
jgi:hypothetical protein